MERDRALPEAGVGASGGGPPAEGYPPEPRTDQQVTDAVRTALFLDPVLSVRQFHVETVDGTVRIWGEVSSPEERRKVIDLVTDVQGVQRVHDDLTVRQRR